MVATKLSAWAAKREGTLNKFYTRPDVGSLLVQELGAISPKRIIDLGAGEGSLAASVVRRWPEASVTTVDIDPSCASDLHTALLNAGCQNHTHHVLDVLDPDLPTSLGQKAFDLAVCNPPFFRPDWKQEFAEILAAADIVDACPAKPDVTAEVLFLAQNLRLLTSSGTVALIIPDGLATSWRALAFRRAILRRCSVRIAIQLPPYSFLDTEAYCFILVIDNKSPQIDSEIKLLRLDDDGAVTAPIYIDAKSAENRLDFAYHYAAQTCAEGSTTLREIGADVRRGSLSTVQRKAMGSLVFHTGDFPVPASSISLGSDIPSNISKQIVIAEAGDILMARVDRELHHKVAFVESGRVAITDCVYRIRVPDRYQNAVFKSLTSQEGKNMVRAVTKGVGARLIGKGELLDIPLKLVF